MELNNNPTKPVSFQLCDANGSGKIDQDDMEQVLTSINDTASYFGDPVLKRSQIKVGRRTQRGERRAYFKPGRSHMTIDPRISASLAVVV